MSIVVIRRVLDSDLPHRLKSVAVALAWWAADDGSRVFPSVERVAWDLGRDRRFVQRMMRQLEGLGVLIRETDARGGRRRTTGYCMNLSALPARDPYKTAACAPPFSKANGGAGAAVSQETAVSVLETAVSVLETAVPVTGNGGAGTARSVMIRQDPYKDLSGARFQDGDGRKSKDTKSDGSLPGPVAIATIIDHLRKSNAPLAATWERQRRRRLAARPVKGSGDRP